MDLLCSSPGFKLSVSVFLMYFFQVTASESKMQNCLSKLSHSTKADRVQEAFGQCSRAHGVTLWDGLVQGQELDLVILVGSFQLSLFCGSVK